MNFTEYVFVIDFAFYKSVKAKWLLEASLNTYSKIAS